MHPSKNHTRRNFIKTGIWGTAGIGLSGLAGRNIGEEGVAATNSADRLPYKIGIRQASIPAPDGTRKNMVADFDTFKAARHIAEITGVELQVATGKPNMSDLNVVRTYKAESQKWGLMVPSTAGVWFTRPWGSDAASELLKAIHATELLGARVMLIAFFSNSAPDMSSEKSYGPVVATLKQVAPAAAEAGIILGLENSLSPADNKKLVDLIGVPNIQVYYDLDNMFQYGYGEQVVDGIRLLGKERLAAIHVKNNGKLLSDQWRVDWAGAFRALTEIKYEGWLMFETEHGDFEKCIKETALNIRFIKQHFHPPAV
ncbi:MAG TPA: sugar phosphate isomerase/epimerase family protein [Niabella sp.]